MLTKNLNLINQIFLRIIIKLFSSLTIGIAISLCIFDVYTVFQLRNIGLIGINTSFSNLLFSLTQYSTYYILWMPLIAFWMNGLVNIGPLEPLICVRSATQNSYITSKIFSNMICAFAFSLWNFFAGILIFSHVRQVGADWHISCQYMESLGLFIVSGKFLHLPIIQLIFMQLFLHACSYFAIGLQIQLLYNLGCKSNFVLLVVMAKNFGLLLALKTCVLNPLNPVLPYRYLFLPFMDNIYDYFIAVIYWTIIILSFICAVYWTSIKWDVMNVYDEKSCC